MPSTKSEVGASQVRGGLAMNYLIIITQRSVKQQTKFGMTWDQRQALAITATIFGLIMIVGVFGTP
jgi:uncharacterized membrane protein